MLDQWHFWTAYLGTGVLLVLLAWLGSRRRRLSPKQLAAGGQPAACGSCGYDLTGLPGNTCPECGSDLELVGRLSPLFYRWAGVPMTARVIVWTVVVAALGGAWFYIAAENSLPREQKFRATGQWLIWAELPDGTPERSQYIPMQVSVTAGFTRQVWPDEWNIDAMGQHTEPHEDTRWSGGSVDLRQSTPTVRDGKLVGALPVATGLVYFEPDARGKARIVPFSTQIDSETDTHAGILKLLSQAKYDGQFGTVDELATALAPEIEEFLRYGAMAGPSRTSPWQHNGSMISQRGQPELRAPVVVVASGFWFAVWLIGLPFILRRRPLSIRREETA